MTKYLWFQKRTSNYDSGVDLLGFFENPSPSVLAGQVSKRFLCSAGTEEELQELATKEGYDVDISDIDWFHPMLFNEPPLPPCPPADFDPGYCGERWDDDY